MIPKFRAWHKELKLMFPVLTLEFFCSGELHEVHFVDPENKDELLICYAKEIELMQCVGLKDTNGLLIYEGDILVLYAPWGTDTCLIERSELTHQLHGRTLYLPGDNTFNFEDFDLENRVIVGNVWAQPGLLNADTEA